jgi:putative transposase
MALARRQVPDGLLHHSDRGVQYASDAYQKLLSDTRPRNPSLSGLASGFRQSLVMPFAKELTVELVGEFHQIDFCPAVRR